MSFKRKSFIWRFVSLFGLLTIATMTVNENFRIGSQLDFIFSAGIDLAVLLTILLISVWCGERSAYFEIQHLHSSGHNGKDIAMKLGIDFNYISEITTHRH